MRGAKMTGSAALMSIALASCAKPDAHIYPISISGQRVVGNEAWVGIDNVWNEGDAFPLAERHCAKYGKVSRFASMQGYRATFDCVASSAGLAAPKR